MNISLIMAASKNGVIGLGDKLPWDLPIDMRWFKKNTVGKMVVQGRKTFESIGFPLPNRDNVVISRDMNFTYPMVNICRSYDAAMSLIKTHLIGHPDDEIMVIGGAEIFTLFEPVANKIYYTEVDVNIDLPEMVKVDGIDPHLWIKTFEESWERDTENFYSGTFYIFERS